MLVRLKPLNPDTRLSEIISTYGEIWEVLDETMSDWYEVPEKYDTVMVKSVEHDGVIIVVKREDVDEIL
jgi:hypothetical protein